MIQDKDLLAFDFYKKKNFTGSYKGMRYLIKKGEENDLAVFEVYTWPGPYNFESTDEKLRVSQTFVFEPESLHKIADYLNTIYEAKKDSWPLKIS